MLPGVRYISSPADLDLGPILTRRVGIFRSFFAFGRHSTFGWSGLATAIMVLGALWTGAVLSPILSGDPTHLWWVCAPLLLTATFVPLVWAIGGRHHRRHGFAKSNGLDFHAEEPSPEYRDAIIFRPRTDRYEHRNVYHGQLRRLPFFIGTFIGRVPGDDGYEPVVEYTYVVLHLPFRVQQHAIVLDDYQDRFQGERLVHPALAAFLRGGYRSANYELSTNRLIIATTGTTNLIRVLPDLLGHADHLDRNLHALLRRLPADDQLR